MNPKYTRWIEEYVTAQPQRFVRGKCDEATRQMVEAFPELRRAAGFVYVQWGRDQHWWCVTKEGEIVDPTFEQFGVFGVQSYEELDLEDPVTQKRVPTGRCMDCGEDVYGGNVFCNAECEEATRLYMEGPSLFASRE